MGTFFIGLFWVAVFVFSFYFLGWGVIVLGDKIGLNLVYLADIFNDAQNRIVGGFLFSLVLLMIWFVGELAQVIGRK